MNTCLVRTISNHKMISWGEANILPTGNWEVGMYVTNPLQQSVVHPIKFNIPSQLGISPTFWQTTNKMNEQRRQMNQNNVSVIIVCSLQNTHYSLQMMIAPLSPQSCVSSSTWISCIIQAENVVKHVEASLRCWHQMEHLSSGICGEIVRWQLYRMLMSWRNLEISCNYVNDKRED